MNYIKQMNAFLDWSLFHDVSDSEVRVYLAIMHCSNRLFWNSSIPNKSIEKFSDKDKVQVTRIRKRLVELGLIEYENGKKGQAGIYKIKPLYEMNREDDINDGSDNRTNVLSNEVPNPDTDFDTNPDTIIKQKTENKKRKTKNIVPPLPPSHEKGTMQPEELFDRFWIAYPKKKAKPEAKKAWDKLKVSAELFDRIMTAVEKQKQSRDWRKDNGQYIPYPATWLNGKRWEDEVEIDTDFNIYSDTNCVTNSDTDNVFLKILEEQSNEQRGNGQAAFDDKSSISDVVL